MSDDIVKRLRAHTTGTTLCPISRGLTAIAADEIERLTAELAAEREAHEILLAERNMRHFQMTQAVRAERDALRAQLNDAGKALQDFVSYGCPACGGDCSAANPPVSLCPMQSARTVLDKIKRGEE